MIYLSTRKVRPLKVINLAMSAEGSLTIWHPNCGCHIKDNINEA